MEKRVFFLSPRPSRRAVIAVSALSAVAVGMILWSCVRVRSGLVWLAPMILFGWWSYVFPPGGRIEISDEGLFLTRRRGVGYMLRWNAIMSVRLHEHSSAARLWSAIIEDSNGRVVKVPRKCQYSGEIVEILRQHLPETVFQAW